MFPLRCNHDVLKGFWQEQWLITYSQTAVSAVWLELWCMMVDVVRKSSFFSHQSAWSFCPQWNHCCIYKDYFETCGLCIVLKLNVLLDVKVVGECWLFFIENAVVAVFLFCLLFYIFYRQINKWIVKLKHWKGNKRNQQLLSRISRCFFPQLK